MKGDKMRLTIDTDTAISLKIKLENILKSDLANNIDFTDDDNKEIRQLIKQIEANLTKPKSSAKQRAAQKATNIRQERAKEKIRNAVNLLHLENAKVNVNSVSKKAGVAYNTVKRYSYLLYQID